MKSFFGSALILAAMMSISGCDGTDSSESPSNTEQPSQPKPWTPLPFDETINAKFTTSDYICKYHFFMDSSGLFSYDYSTSIPNSGVLKDSNGVEILSFTSAFKCPLRPGEYFIDWKIPYGNVPNGSATIPFMISIDDVDTSEYNDKAPFASKIEMGSTVVTKLIPKFDVDYFQFELNKPTITKIQISNIPSSLPIVATLYDAELVEIYSAAYPVNQDSIIIGKALNAGTYYIKLRTQYSEYSSDNQFYLKVSQYHVDTTEYNNTISTAPIVEFGAPFKANIWPIGDVDYYEILATDTATMKVALDSVSSKIELNCQVFDAEGTSLTSAQSASSCKFKPASAGAYYFKFWDNYNDASSEKQHIITITK
ncbi:MAG: PPC domain-containing protein [Fibrobacteria bacterium]|nr:PPC domain-containing protein [Fibrobacteria bacterium]